MTKARCTGACRSIKCDYPSSVAQLQTICSRTSMIHETNNDKKALVEVCWVALKHLNRRAGHNGRDGMFIHQLDLTIAA